MIKRKPRHPQPSEGRCDSCAAPAIGTITFFADDGKHRFAVCMACMTDAINHSAPGVRLRFRAYRTKVEFTRGLLGGAA